MHVQEKKGISLSLTLSLTSLQKNTLFMFEREAREREILFFPVHAFICKFYFNARRAVDQKTLVLYKRTTWSLRRINQIRV